MTEADASDKKFVFDPKSKLLLDLDWKTFYRVMAEIKNKLEKDEDDMRKKLKEQKNLRFALIHAIRRLRYNDCIPKPPN